MVQKAAIYARVSTDKQVKEGDSIQAQLDALRKYVADHKDMIISGEYVDDGISGTKFAERDELQRMLSDVKDGKIDVILFTKLDRFYRSIRHYTSTQEVLDKYGVGWKAIWEAYDTTTPQGRLIVNAMMAFSQYEAENAGARIRQVFKYKISQGEVLSGTVAVGYKVVNKHLVPSEKAEQVKDIFEYYALHGNLAHTVIYASGFDGFPTSRAGIKRMLTNKIYIGIYRDNASYCQPIISKELFDRVQSNLCINVKDSQKHPYIFSGLCKCALCGNAMSASAFRGGNTPIRRRYRCPGYYSPSHSCSNKRLISDMSIEEHLLLNIKPYIQGMLLDAEIEEKEEERTSKIISSVNRKLDRLKDLYINDLISIDEYKARRADFENQIADAEQVKPSKDLSELKSLLKMDIEHIYQTFSDEEKRYFWRSIIKEIRINDGTVKEIIFV